MPTLFQPLRQRPWPRDRFGLVISRGYVQLVRHSGRPPGRAGARPLRPLDRELELPDPGPEPDDQPGEASPEDEGGAVPGRGDRGQTRRSRNNTRRMFMSLAWELLGPRPAMVSLTYPGDWKLQAPTRRAASKASSQRAGWASWTLP